jgi:hypothetical protein
VVVSFQRHLGCDLDDFKVDSKRRCPKSCSDEFECFCDYLRKSIYFSDQ